MKEYLGRFPINKGLTQKLNYKGYLIYRDPEVGLYAYNPESKLDVNLFRWNLSLRELDSATRQHIINDIVEAEEESV